MKEQRVLYLNVTPFSIPQPTLVSLPALHQVPVGSYRLLGTSEALDSSQTSGETRASLLSSGLGKHLETRSDSSCQGS